MGKSSYKKTVIEPGELLFLIYIQSQEIMKKMVAGVALKQSK